MNPARPRTLRQRVVACLALAAGFVGAAVADPIGPAPPVVGSSRCTLFIEPGGIRVNWDLGSGDLRFFRDLLPDPLHARLGGAPAPLAERQQRFLTKTWPLIADGQRLPGRVEFVAAPPAEALADTNAPPVAVALTLRYDLTDQPAYLRVPPLRTPPGTRPEDRPAIVFTAYHRGVPVTDPRYLGRGEVLDLNWDDPWYSRFRSDNMWSTFVTPLNVFLYVEPFQVRVEIIVRPKDLQSQIDLGLAGQKTIPVARQEALKRRVADFLTGIFELQINDQPVMPKLARIVFLERSRNITRVIDPPRELNRFAAALGVNFVAPTTGFPETADLDWRLFPPGIKGVRAAVSDAAGPVPYKLTAEDNHLHWQPTAGAPALQAALPVPPPPAPVWRMVARYGWLACLLSGGALVWTWWEKPRRWGRIGAAVLLLAAVLGTTLAARHAIRLDPAQATATVAGILQHLYRAFDFQDEETTYDRLAEHLTGDLLTRTYLEIRQSLELANQGGARVKVTRVRLLSAEITPRPETDGFTADCAWNVTGFVGHWGHVHQRTNQYEAHLTVQPVAGHWKLTRLDLTETARLP